MKKVYLTRLLSIVESQRADPVSREYLHVEYFKSAGLSPPPAEHDMVSDGGLL